MLKNKRASVALAAVLTILVVNLLSWAFVGRDTAILLAARDFDSAGAFDPGDTLFVFTGVVPDIDPADQISSIGVEAQREFAAQLQSSAQAGEVVLHSGTFSINHPSPIDYSENEAAFFPSLNRSLPMVAEVEAVLYSPGFVLSRHRTGIWFFRWWLVKDELDSIS